MGDKRRRWLIESLGEYLVPAFQEHGFQLVPLLGEEARSSELRLTLPFGYLRRVTPRGFDLVEIQLDKHGDAAFRLNIGVAPVGGIDHDLVGHINQEDVRVHDLDRYFEAYSWPLFWRWFAVRRGWFGPPATKADYVNLVEDNLGLVREVEDV